MYSTFKLIKMGGYQKWRYNNIIWNYFKNFWYL